MIRPAASQAAPEQGDLFEDRGTCCGPDIPQQNMADDEYLEALPDKDLVEKIAKATLSNVELRCAQIVERGLGDVAVPELVRLWNRFKGFGIKSPLPEQQLALETLAAIGSDAAKSAISKILAAPGLPDSLLPFALQAAERAGLNLQQAQVLPWLEHDAPTVRAQAYALLQSSNPQRSTLEIGFSDPDPSVRRAALISTGNLGHGSAKAGLLAEFRKNPTGQIIEALLSVADDDIIVEVGRYALANPPHQALIADELQALDTPKARMLALKLPFVMVSLCLASLALMTFLALEQSKGSLEKLTDERLSSLLEGRASHLETFLENVEFNLTVQASNPSLLDAVFGLKGGWREFEDPRAYLHEMWITNNPFEFGERENFVDAGDENNYTRTHKRYHGFFRTLMDNVGLYDVILIDTQGNVLYTVEKEDDFATNILGPVDNHLEAMSVATRFQQAA